TEIDADGVAACAGNVHRHNAFDLADALGQRDRQRALGLLRRVLADEREALRVLHALVGHFRRLWQVKELLDSGAPQGQIERSLRRSSATSARSYCRCWSFVRPR